MRIHLQPGRLKYLALLLSWKVRWIIYYLKFSLFAESPVWVPPSTYHLTGWSPLNPIHTPPWCPCAQRRPGRSRWPSTRPIWLIWPCCPLLFPRTKRELAGLSQNFSMEWERAVWTTTRQRTSPRRSGSVISAEKGESKSPKATSRKA